MNADFNHVHLTPARRQIYTLDEERKMDFESANRFGETAARTYERLGYETLEVPRVSIEERTNFVIGVIDGSLGGAKNAKR